MKQNGRRNTSEKLECRNRAISSSIKGRVTQKRWKLQENAVD